MSEARKRRRSRSHDRVLAMAAGTTALLACLAVAGYAAGRMDEAEHVVDDAAMVSVHPESSDEPARAAIDWFVPMLGNDEGFRKLVAEELWSDNTRWLDETAQKTLPMLREIRRQIAANGLPDVVIGVPYVESRLRSDLVSIHCAAGPWQFLPESGTMEGLRVQDCVLDDGTVFTPDDEIPYSKRVRYWDDEGCHISHCQVDERLDFAKSTRAAMSHVARSYHSKTLREHPLRIPLTILAYNYGLGGVQKLLAATDHDPFSVVPSCAHGDCLVLGHEQAWYVPKVVAAAAVVACGAADPRQPDLADWARSDMCRTLHAYGMAPAPVTDAEALAGVATNYEKGWRVGVVATVATDAALYPEARRVDDTLARALADIPGVVVMPAVPGERTEDLFADGAHVVIAPEIGRRGERLWLRLESWDEGAEEPRGGAFAMLGLELPSAEDATTLLADALLRPDRERQGDAIGALVATYRDELNTCLPAVVTGEDEALATVSLRVNGDGRPAAVTVKPSALDGDAALAACLEERLSAIAFPRELVGAGTTLQIGVEAPAVVSVEDH